MTAADPVGAYFDAVNAEDWDTLALLWEPDAELSAVGARPRHGRNEILAYYPKLLSGYAEHLDAPLRRITEGSAVAVEIRFTGRTTSGRLISFDAVDVFDLTAIRIRKLTIWYDTAAVSRQVRDQ